MYPTMNMRYLLLPAVGQLENAFDARGGRWGLAALIHRSNASVGFGGNVQSAQ